MIFVEIEVTAQFYDLDPMGIVWHGHYVRFMETARCALLDRIGYNYEAMGASGYIWPIVDMRIKYVRSVRFAQICIVRAILTETANRLKIDYIIRDKISGELLTKAFTVQVGVNKENGELCIESPAALTDKVKEDSL